MRFRGKSIRRKIVALLLVPLVSLTGLWAFATVITGSEAAQLLSVADVMRTVGFPAEDMVRALQKERRQTLVYLADPRRSDALAALRGQQGATDKMVETFRGRARGDVRDDMSSEAADRFTGIEKSLDDLESLRRRVEEDTISRRGAFEAYNELVEPYYAFLDSLSALQDADMDKQGRALVGLARAREALSREDALLAAALTSGTLSRQELRTVSDRVAERQVLYRVSLGVLPATERDTFEDYWRGADAQTLRTAEDAVVLAAPGRAAHAIDAQRWQTAAGTVLDGLAKRNNEAGDHYADRVEPVAIGVLTKAAVAGVLGLAALVCSLVISLRVGRGLVLDLRRLRKEAHEVSGVRLPSVMRRLAAGERVDVETEAPRHDYGPDELGQVGKALNTLQRAAVEAAVKQADMRRGVSDVFVNLARRSQVLLHRQLALLDAMERRTEDTEELADLFRLDHLTTRMRRHAEGLVILSGAAPARQWRKPVRLMDVVRGAVAEVEAYERIEVRRLPRLSVLGPAVGDLIHLLAELLENATVFSPPHTGVQVMGERVPNGFTLEIHDRGLGMAPDALLEANLRLAETPEFELSDTDRLGLFVVSRLAQRHGVRVSLQPSPYGGTTAVVFLPLAVLTEGPAGKGSGADEDTGEQTAPRGVGPLSPLSALATPPGGVLRTPREDAAGPRPEPCPLEDRPDDGGDAQHHQASDPLFPLPRRRAPVLVSDHGRPVAPRDRPEDPAAEPTPTGGLPRRVRQASLAPQLRNDPTPAHGRAAAAPDPGGPEAERDADEVRARMAALQRGWQRGREENETERSGTPTGTPPSAPPGTPPRTTAPRTTSEGDGP
ncbi:nitrate- and nitrite sensing domain-containing protein [Streptomyces sp. ISL-11]|uniref:nitrate- and nitrite sensing domain-containing protein n=1 Tax=Streptomyces sp. ISL-11 TaxID=2819174 RepID=UPI001BE8219B|nr:nitrate- and nitrite sensing domain-containing protein [Streptomyces sp. ISL-11]MBT2386029.1 nitrate- and nitrite sensing domain-containing protein [Streptomyces sp. ISL-11]